MDKGLQDFENRKPLILDILRKRDFDVICFQEVMPEAYMWLKDALPDFEFTGCGRLEDFSDEAVPIAFKKDRFTVADAGTFWLSNTPDIPGSRCGASYWPRICTWASVCVKNDMCAAGSAAGASAFRIYNTHLDNEYKSSARCGTELILSRISDTYAADRLPVILTGDMNSTPDSEIIKRLESGSEPRLIDHTAGLAATSHGYGKIEEKIDYVFTDSTWASEGAELIKAVKDGVYISDHWPVCVKLTHID